jgi:hypothetical protein
VKEEQAKAVLVAQRDLSHCLARTLVASGALTSAIGTALGAEVTDGAGLSDQEGTGDIDSGRLIEELRTMSLFAQEMQRTAQVQTQFYSVMANALKAQHDAARNIVKNIR